MKCSTKFCRNPASLTYKGKDLCDDCWDKSCKIEPSKTLVEGSIKFPDQLEPKEIRAAQKQKTLEEDWF